MLKQSGMRLAKMATTGVKGNLASATEFRPIPGGVASIIRRKCSGSAVAKQSTTHHAPMDLPLHRNRNATVVLHSAPGKPATSQHNILQEHGQFLQLMHPGRRDLWVSIYLSRLPLTKRGKPFSYAAFLDRTDTIVLKTGRHNTMKFQVAELLMGPKVEGHGQFRAVISLLPGSISGGVGSPNVTQAGGNPILKHATAVLSQHGRSISNLMMPTAIALEASLAKTSKLTPGRATKPLFWSFLDPGYISHCQAHAYKQSSGRNPAWCGPAKRAMWTKDEAAAIRSDFARPWSRPEAGK